MMPLKHQHRPQPHSPLAASPHNHPHPLRLLQKRIPLRTIERQKRALALPAQVQDLLRIPLRQALEAVVQVLARVLRIVDEIQTFDLIDDPAEEDRARGIPHPGVELAVRFRGNQVRVPEVVARGLGFFAKGDHVRRGLEAPVLVGPEFPGGADSSLDLVDDEEHVVAFCDFAEAAEEGGGGVVVATFGLDGLDDDGGNGIMEGLHDVFGFFETAGFLCGVLGGELIEGVFEEGEGRLGPVEGGDIEFVDGFAASGGEGAEETAVESGAEGHDGHLRGAGLLVVHGGGDFFGGGLGVAAAAALLEALVHKGGFVGELVGLGAGGGGEDFVEVFRCDFEHALLEDLGVVVLGEVAEGGTVDDGAGHLGRGG